ncbi:copper amine oxidase N-terminal domain-containing protein [Paenibacillus tianjinensis]|uniref:Copper amine oxidase N-terminal domain-containing protein n=1 Tax=Paenibacillus tianjinensis TaxID=2810347 RepID=A0ABX7LFN3_9BACL|nr:copper amine oxidase N-terminal domain-containing protein [Paenibacillus tianjinensis]QSF45689.1 copper amine oxidase N-terminal domain-containing protein [Paenibacillus tianjinensis]
MKKFLSIFASCLVAVSMMSGAALAKSENGNGKGNSNGNSTKEAVVKPAATPAATPAADKAKEKEKEKGNEKAKESVTSVTYATYENKGHNGYKGLLNAIENVKDKPAGAVIAGLLLTKYNTELTPEMKAELEAIQDKDAALSALADMLKERGSVTDAVYVQKEAILANVKNLNSYKKLGELYAQTGQNGIKLYVNGEESTSAVAPILKAGTTLVPFKAIAEALQAEVVWNAKDRSVTMTREGTTVKLFIDKKTAYVNGQEIILQVTPAIVKGNTVVPARFVSEALKATVKWEPVSQSVVIYEE